MTCRLSVSSAGSLSGLCYHHERHAVGHDKAGEGFSRGASARRCHQRTCLYRSPCRGGGTESTDIVAAALAIHALAEGIAAGTLLGRESRRRAGVWLAAMCLSPAAEAATASAWLVPVTVTPLLLSLAQWLPAHDAGSH